MARESHTEVAAYGAGPNWPVGATTKVSGCGEDAPPAAPATAALVLPSAHCQQKQQLATSVIPAASLDVPRLPVVLPVSTVCSQSSSTGGAGSKRRSGRPRYTYTFVPRGDVGPQGGASRSAPAKRAGLIPDVADTARHTLLASLTLNSYKYVPDPDRPGRVKCVKNTKSEGFGNVPGKLLVRTRRSDRNRHKIRTRNTAPGVPCALKITIEGAPPQLYPEVLGEWTMPDMLLYSCNVCKSFLPCNPHLHLPCTEHRLALVAPIDSVPLALEERIPIPEPGTERFKKIAWTEVAIENGTVKAQVEHRRPKNKAHPEDVQQQQHAPARISAEQQGEPVRPLKKRSRFLEHLKDQSKAEGLPP